MRIGVREGKENIEMGKVTGFLEIDRQDREVPAGGRPHPAISRSSRGAAVQKRK
jgi:hypothetical protein